jgi:hypothetical protein
MIGKVLAALGKILAEGLQNFRKNAEIRKAQ